MPIYDYEMQCPLKTETQCPFKTIKFHTHLRLWTSIPFKTMKFNAYIRLWNSTSIKDSEFQCPFNTVNFKRTNRQIKRPTNSVYTSKTLSTRAVKQNFIILFTFFFFFFFFCFLSVVLFLPPPPPPPFLPHPSLDTITTTAFLLPDNEWRLTQWGPWSVESSTSGDTGCLSCLFATSKSWN